MEEEDKMMAALDRSDMSSRYRITGRLVMDTALHVGGGSETSTITDSPVIRKPSGEPFIPGSSIKGAFRAAVERLAPLLKLTTCQLAPDYEPCLTNNKDLGKHYRTIAALQGQELTYKDETQEAMSKIQEIISTFDLDTSILSSIDWPNWEGQTITKDHLLALLSTLLCDTCKTFGSQYLVSTAFFQDLSVEEGAWYDIFQIRDGVGIDRDSERAVPKIKFDYEVVPPETPFAFSLILENPRQRDLELIAVGLQEFVQGMVPLGGIRSRGLGRCHLNEEDLVVEWAEFEDQAKLREYLLTGNMSDREKGTSFIARYIESLLGDENKEENDAQATAE
jgi:CRISPR/Cas system CSM-associated protein Csm3 (group 7 of RAMP superfamily)